MAQGHKTGGRQRGTPNKITRAFRDAVQVAFDAIGGDEAFAAWARENPTEFYRIAARLIPTELTGSEKGGVTVIIAGNSRQGDELDAQDYERVEQTPGGDSRRLLA